MNKRTNNEQTSKWISLLTSALVTAVLITLLTGCDDDEIRAYQSPKSDPYSEPKLLIGMDGMGGMDGMQAPASTSKNTIGWHVPDDWIEDPNASSILTAAYIVQGETGDARITVTKLGSGGGGVLANINRWRGQVGLDPIESIDAQEKVSVQVDDQTCDLIDLVKPENAGQTMIDRMMVVMLPRPQDGLTWYFKMTGSVDALEEHKPAFITFVESIKFGVEQAPTEPNEPASAGDAGE